MKYLLLSLALGLCACPGPQGPAGNNGIDGSCETWSITTPNPGTVISCSDGSQSFILSGTVIQPVQFCKNTVTTYPSTFSEVGFCISGVLYGVYSLNDGFMSALPNGNYSSNGVNASCTFTVTGCTISNQSN